MKIFRILALAIALTAGLFSSQVDAHGTAEHYIWLEIDAAKLGGEVEFSVRDLNDLLGYDLDPEVAINATALAPYTDSLADYVEERLAFTSSGQTLPLQVTSVRDRSFEEGEFVMVRFEANSPAPLGEYVTVRDEIMFDVDLQHRGILLIRSNARTGENFREREALVFSAFNSEQALNLDNPPRLLTRLQFIWQGMLHIFIGLDHILFLLCLLLTAVLVRRGNEWAPNPSFMGAFWKVFAIVTLFTAAHSITLFLAGLGYVRLPARWVESVIALSIIVVALSNLLGRWDAKKHWIILVFGLFHGLGFASVMAELPFRLTNLFGVVLFFNIGVELGQIVIVALLFPFLFWARNSRFYQPVVLQGGSIAIAALASWWLVERAFELA